MKAVGNNNTLRPLGSADILRLSPDFNNVSLL